MMSDLIRRSDAIKAIEALAIHTDERYLNDLEYGHNEGLAHAIDRIEDIPSSDRPQGEWIRDRYWSRGVGMGEEYGFFYKCSMCEYEVESGYTRCGFNYCPNCGADMRKGADDE